MRYAFALRNIVENLCLSDQISTQNFQRSWTTDSLWGEDFSFVGLLEPSWSRWAEGQFHFLWFFTVRRALQADCTQQLQGLSSCGSPQKGSVHLTIFCHHCQSFKESHCHVDQAGLKLKICLLQLPRCWYPSHTLSDPIICNSQWLYLWPHVS